jgi:hypothetical protein
MKMPSGRVGLTLIIVAVVVGLTIIISTVYDRFFVAKQNTDSEKVLSVEVNKQDSEADSDGDGLTDWEEILWNTNAHNPDTDGDKTNDGNEVSQNRDPKKAGPDDKIVSLQDYIDNYKPMENLDENSLTTAVAKNLFTNFAKMRQGGQLNSENTQELVKTLIDQASSQITTPDRYSANNLFTFKSSDKTQLKEYGNKFVSIQYEEMIKYSQDTKSTQYLDPIISAYQTMADRLSVIPVPEDLKSVHANVINNLYKISIVLENMKKADTDPIMATLSIPQYEKIAKEQDLLTSQIGTFLQQSGIIFEDGDAGNILFKTKQ